MLHCLLFTALLHYLVYCIRFGSPSVATSGTRIPCVTPHAPRERLEQADDEARGAGDRTLPGLERCFKLIRRERVFSRFDLLSQVSQNENIVSHRSKVNCILCVG